MSTPASTSTTTSTSSSAPTSRADAKLDKVRADLSALLNAQKFYEALQLYKTLYNRSLLRKKYDEAQTLMEEGARQLLSHKQGNAGGELAVLLIEVWTKINVKPTKEHEQTLLSIFDLFPDDARSAALTYMKQAINWTAAKGSNPNGSPSLHLALARFYEKAKPKDYASAHKHYLRSENPHAHVQLLLDWSQAIFASERDLLIVRTVLQYACLEDLQSGNIVYKLYTQGIQQEKNGDADAVLNSPIMHFAQFLLLTLERDAAPLFEMLRQKYAIALTRDSSFASYLDKIGELYFGIQAPKGMMDILGKGLLS